MRVCEVALTHIGNVSMGKTSVPPSWPVQKIGSVFRGAGGGGRLTRDEDTGARLYIAVLLVSALQIL